MHKEDKNRENKIKKNDKKEEKQNKNKMYLFSIYMTKKT